jgi:hypothetical protein
LQVIDPQVIEPKEKRAMGTALNCDLANLSVSRCRPVPRSVMARFIMARFIFLAGNSATDRPSIGDLS